MTCEWCENAETLSKVTEKKNAMKSSQQPIKPQHYPFVDTYESVLLPTMQVMGAEIDRDTYNVLAGDATVSLELRTEDSVLSAR